MHDILVGRFHYIVAHFQMQGTVDKLLVTVCFIVLYCQQSVSGLVGAGIAECLVHEDSGSG